MRRLSALATFALGLAAGTLAGCVTAKGPVYPETLAQLGPPAAEHARIVFLRPDQRYDDASANRIVLRIDEKVVGELAYGGYVLANVKAGEIELQASHSNRYIGTCRLALEVPAGETRYFDVAPRPANAAAGAIGTVFGGAIAGGSVASPSQVAVGGAVGGQVAGTAESTGKTCGGPYRITPLAPAVALEHLDRLRASE
jgi:hypothetical protein